jgi:hypothetical protein
MIDLVEENQRSAMVRPEVPISREALICGSLSSIAGRHVREVGDHGTKPGSDHTKPGGALVLAGGSPR